MNNIKDYKVISRQGLNELESEVKIAINDGWQPIGGVSSFPIHDSKAGKGVIVYSQAMVVHRA